MSVEIKENDEHNEQQLSHVRRQYCKSSKRSVYDDNPPPNGDRTKPEGSKHPYFLRAKTPRFIGFPMIDHENGEFKKPSSSYCKLVPDNERIMSPFLSLPTQSHGSESQHCDEYSAPSEEEDLANCLVMLSNKFCADLPSDDKDENTCKEVAEKGMFQCKACKKVFNSHQALGGHRASHKKVKGCFASKPDGHNDENSFDEDSIQEDQEPLPPSESDVTRTIPTTTTRKRAKMHECSVCSRVFTSGQALGGHKRCHWLTTSTDNAFIPNFHDFQYDHRSQQLCKKPVFKKPNHDHDHDHQFDLNLNLPPPTQHYQSQEDDETTRFEASTRLCLQQWANHNQQKIESEVIDKHGEEGCGMKLRKPSDLRDVNLDEGWLQMGFASISEMR